MPTAYAGNSSNVQGGAVTTVSGASNAAPIVIQTTAPHGYATGNVVGVSAVTGNTAANGTWRITVTDATHFALDTSAGNGAWAGGGSVVNTSLMPAFNIPSDGDTRNASSVNVGFEALADRSQYLAELVSNVSFQTVTFNAAGTYTTGPFETKVKVFGYGGGGGGGGGCPGSDYSDTASQTARSQGGGGGGAASPSEVTISVLPNTTYAVYVGVGGVGGGVGNGGDGEASYFANDGVTEVYAIFPGGSGGLTGTQMVAFGDVGRRVPGAPPMAGWISSIVQTATNTVDYSVIGPQPLTPGNGGASSVAPSNGLQGMRSILGATGGGGGVFGSTVSGWVGGGGGGGGGSCYGDLNTSSGSVGGAGGMMEDDEGLPGAAGGIGVANTGNGGGGGGGGANSALSGGAGGSGGGGGSGRVIVTAVFAAPVVSPVAPDLPLSGMVWNSRADHAIVSGGLTWPDESDSGPVASVAQVSGAPTITAGALGRARLACTLGTNLTAAGNVVPTGTTRTVLVLCQVDADGGTLVSFKSDVPYCALMALPDETYWVIYRSGGVTHKLNPPPPTGVPIALMYEFTVGENILRMWVNGRRVYPSTQENGDIALSPSDTGTSGFIIGSDPDATGFDGSLYQLTAWDRALTTPERAQCFNYAVEWIGITLETNKANLAIFDGDSITRGNGVSLATQSYPGQAAALLGVDWEYANMGRDGCIVADVIYRSPRQVDFLLVEFARTATAYVYMCGTNNLSAGWNANDVFDGIETRQVAAMAAGWDKVIVNTITGRDDAPIWSVGDEAERVACNNLIDDLPTVVDLRVDSNIETAAIAFFPDRLHPNTAGCALIASPVADKILEAPSTWVPSDMVDIRLWQDADHVIMTGSKVSQLTDMSGLANHAFQATDADRPLIDANYLNGHDAMIGDGNVFLQGTSNVLATPSGTYTIWFVGQIVLGADPSGGAFFCERVGTDYASAMHFKFLSHYVYGDGTNAASNIEMLPQRYTDIDIPFASIRRMKGVGLVPDVDIDGTASTLVAGTNQTAETGTAGYQIMRNPQPSQRWGLTGGGRWVMLVVKEGVASPTDESNMATYIFDTYGLTV